MQEFKNESALKDDIRSDVKCLSGNHHHYWNSEFNPEIVTPF